MIDPAAGVSVHSYDPSGTLLQVNDPRDLATRYGVDGLGNPARLASPDTGVATQTFDAAGNILTRVDARGVTATSAYDALGRVTQVAYTKAGSPTEAHAFEYDGGPNAEGQRPRSSIDAKTRPRGAGGALAGWSTAAVVQVDSLDRFGRKQYKIAFEPAAPNL